MKLIRILVWILIFQMFTVVAYSSQGRLLTFSCAEDTSASVSRVLYYAFKQLGYEFTVSLQGMTSAVITANTGQTDGLVSYLKETEQDYPNLISVDEPVYSVSFETYVKRGNTLPINSWEDLSNYKVGFLVQKLYIDNHVPQSTDVTRYESFGKLWDALQSGAIDVAVVTRTLELDYVVEPDIERNSVLDSVSGVALINKKNADLVPKLNEVLAEMNKSGITKKLLRNEMKVSDDQSNKIILHLSSFSSDMPWERALHTVLQEKYSDAPYEFHTINLNTLQMNYDYKNKMTVNAIQKDFISKAPDMIVVSDNEALKLAKEFYNVAFSSTPIVFMGINNFKPEMIGGFENIATGVAEKNSVKETVDQILKMFPDTKNLLVINDYTDTGRAVQADMEQELVDYAGKLNVMYNENMTYDDLMEQVSSLSKDTVILSGFYFVDANQSFHFSNDYQTKLWQNAKVPYFGIFDPGKTLGEIGGKYTEPTVQATLTCEIIDKVLNNTQVKDIPVVYNTDEQNTWTFDQTVLKKWGISKLQLPKGSVILNNGYNIIEEDPALLGILVMFGAIVSILGFYTLRQGRRNAELVELQKTLHSKEEILKKEAAITETKKQQTAYMSIAPFLFIVTVNQNIVYLNKFAEETTGLVLGQTIDGLYQDIKQAKSILRKTVSDGQASGEVLKLKTASGVFRSFFVNFMKSDFEGKKAIVLCGMDIEEAEQQDRLLESMQLNLQRVMDALPLPAVIKDNETFKTVYANEAYLRLFTENSLTKEMVVKKESATVYDQSLQMKTGEMMEASIYARKVFYNGTACEIHVIQDVTAEFRQKEMLLSAAEKEKEANKIKSRFVVNMSHEVRTPMNAIIGLTEIALTKDFGKEINTSFKKVNISAKHLLNIINDVLDFSKMEADKLELFESDFALKGTLEDALLFAEERIGNKKVEVYTNFEERLPKFVQGDKMRYWQVVKNLTENAAKFTEKGSITVTASCADYNETDECVEVTVTVEDTGLGMTGEQVEKLFIPFEQFHQGLPLTGTGLGLSISKQLVTLMGGTIHVESKLNVGTKATVMVPFKIAVGDLEEESNIKKVYPKASVLVAEDNEINQEVVAGMLELYEITPQFANNGQEAIEWLGKQKFDLVLMDVHMPVMGGLEASEQIRKSVANYNKIPIVAMTGDVNKEEVDLCLQAGMNGHMAKPIDMDVLSQTLKTWLA